MQKIHRVIKNYAICISAKRKAKRTFTEHIKMYSIINHFLSFIIRTIPRIKREKEKKKLRAYVNDHYVIGKRERKESYFII